jgi:hypothetical protein
MAVPIFNINPDPRIAALANKQKQLFNRALQLGATPQMLNTVTRGAVTPNYTTPPPVYQGNVPVGSEFDVDFNAPVSRYVPDQRSAREILSSSNSPFALIGRGVNAIANIPNMSLPALVPPYDPVAAKEQTQSLVNQNAIDTDILQDQYNLDKERRIADANISQYIPNIFKSRAPSYVVGGSQGMQDTRDIGIAKDRVAIQQEIDTGKKEIVESLQAGGMTAGEAEFNLDVLRQRQDRLNRAVQKTDENSAKFDKDREELLKSLGEDPTIKRGLSPSGTTDDTFKEKTPEEKSKELQTAKIQTKLKDTSALDKSEGQGSGADNWFDAVNERVDLMAMGAAMLAGSSSGEGTLANLGKGLQAGIAAKKAETQAAEAKKYRDAALALDAIRAQAASRRAKAQEMAALAKDPLTWRESVDALSSELQVAGADEANTKVISQFIMGTPQLSGFLRGLDKDNRQLWIKEFVDVGQGWVGDELELGNVNKAVNRATQKLIGTK